MWLVQKIGNKEFPAMTQVQRHNLSDYWQGQVNWDVSMADYCTFRAGGKVDALVSVSSHLELEKLVQFLREQEIIWRVIGRGSNILVSGNGYGGVLILLAGEFSTFQADAEPEERDGRKIIRVGAGCPVSKLVSWCTENSLSGLEFMAGIPGSVGGAVYMNAGAWGKEIGDCLVRVSFVDRLGHFHDVAAADLVFSYRKMVPLSAGLVDAVIVGAALSLKPGSQKEIIEECRKNLVKRNQKQPTGMASAGSFFKNPEGDSAGRLIDSAGLKGLRKGNAMVSTKHANFIVNTGQATADDIIELMNEVREKVYAASGILLEPEVQLL